MQAAAGLRHIELRAAELDAPPNGGERTLVRCAIVSHSCCATAARMRGAQKHLCMIGERTRAGLAAARKRGVKLGGLNAKGIAERQAARERAERLRPLFAELAGLSARKAAEELNRRSVATPAGGKWHAATVLRVRERLA